MRTDEPRAPGAPAYGTREWLEAQYRRVGSDPWGLEWRPSQNERYHEMIDAIVAARRGALPPQAVLDIGCATGAFTAMLPPALGCAPGAVRGIDVTDLAIERARARHPAIAFERLAIEEAETRFPGRFDLVTMLEVLYYVPEAERRDALRRVRRMLRPGGMLLVSSMIATSPYMSPDRLRALVAGSFEVVASDVLYLKPLALAEKPLLKLLPFVERFARSGPRAAPVRSRVAQRLAALARRAFGARAMSHGWVVAIAGDEDRTR